MLVRNAFIELDSIAVGRRSFKYYVILVGNEELPSFGAGECAKYLIIIRKTFLFTHVLAELLTARGCSFKDRILCYYLSLLNVRWERELYGEARSRSNVYGRSLDAP